MRSARGRRAAALGMADRHPWSPSARRSSPASGCSARWSGLRNAFSNWSTRPIRRCTKALPWSRRQGPPPPSKASDGAELAEAAAAPEAARITVLLGKGQSLLNLDQAEEAVACFDQVLALDANHPEALVKKGAALERLRKLDEAIACYDRAIAADGSLTVAYLYKGGLFNRMERFGEALECYEQALRTQEARHG